MSSDAGAGNGRLWGVAGLRQVTLGRRQDETQLGGVGSGLVCDLCLQTFAKGGSVDTALFDGRLNQGFDAPPG